MKTRIKVSQACMEDEQERTKHQTLGDTLGQRSGGACAVVDVDELLSVCEI